MLLKSISSRGWTGRLTYGWLCGAIVIGMFSGSLALAQSQKPQSDAKSAGAKSGSERSGSERSAARGKYIVESMAICGDCHTPKEPNGSPDRAHWLQGAALPWTPAKPDSNWPANAPRIGGTPLPASDSDMVKLLMTGIWTTGARLRPPMPQFRMNRGDAEAVVVYLKSVSARP